MAQTGYQRSIKIEVNKTVAGIQVPGYPKVYSGLNEFRMNGVQYPAISNGTLASIPTAAYSQRLAGFKLYVQSIEQGLDVDATTLPGQEACRQNLTACPIG
jgi:hypothetical protein